MEQRWRELNLIPTNSELFRRLKKVREANEDDDDNDEEEEIVPTSAPGQNDCKPAKAGQPVYDMWQKLQMMKQIEVNTDGISKVLWELLSAVPSKRGFGNALYALIKAKIRSRNFRQAA